MKARVSDFLLYVCYLRMISILKTHPGVFYCLWHKKLGNWWINFLSHNIMHNGRYVVVYVIQVFWS